jgi:hypothetical protein
MHVKYDLCPHSHHFIHQYSRIIQVKRVLFCYLTNSVMISKCPFLFICILQSFHPMRLLCCLPVEIASLNQVVFCDFVFIYENELRDVIFPLFGGNRLIGSIFRKLKHWGWSKMAESGIFLSKMRLFISCFDPFPSDNQGSESHPCNFFSLCFGELVFSMVYTSTC